jgi:purine-cytosine permease-like protein
VESIVSGQAIASVNEKASISVNMGIGIVCTLSFLMAFLGYRAVNLWQRWQWLPLIAITIAVGCGGKHLINQAGRA